MKKNIKTLIFAAAVFGVVAEFIVLADTVVSISGPFVKSAGGTSSPSCPGKYKGYALMTNSAGGVWFTPPTNVISGTLTNISGFPPPFLAVLQVVRRSDLMTWCGTNSVTFSVTGSDAFQFGAYIKNTPPPPTNGQAVVLQIDWR